MSSFDHCVPSPTDPPPCQTLTGPAPTAGMGCELESYELRAASPAPGSCELQAGIELVPGPHRTFVLYPWELRAVKFSRRLGAVKFSALSSFIRATICAFIIYLQFIYRKNLIFFKIYGIIYIERKKIIKFKKYLKFERRIIYE